MLACVVSCELCVVLCVIVYFVLLCVVCCVVLCCVVLCCVVVSVVLTWPLTILFFPPGLPQISHKQWSCFFCSALTCSSNPSTTTTKTLPMAVPYMLFIQDRASFNLARFVLEGEGGEAPAPRAMNPTPEPESVTNDE